MESNPSYSHLWNTVLIKLTNSTSSLKVRTWMMRQHRSCPTFCKLTSPMLLLPCRCDEPAHDVLEPDCLWWLQTSQPGRRVDIMMGPRMLASEPALFADGFGGERKCSADRQAFPGFTVVHLGVLATRRCFRELLLLAVATANSRIPPEPRAKLATCTRTGHSKRAQKNDRILEVQIGQRASPGAEFGLN